MFTNRAKILFGTLIAVIAVGGLSYGNVKNAQEIVKLENNPMVITKTVIVTPTLEPTATPSAVKIFTPAKAVNPATKGVK